MEHSSAGPSSGFDNFIHYRATASFNAATVELNTFGASEATSATPTTGATFNGWIDVNVNLVAGQPLLAGSYAATLTLSIEPSP